jgi:hypothetical protein
MTATCFFIFLPIIACLAQSPPSVSDSAIRALGKSSPVLLDTNQHLFDSTVADIRNLYQHQKKQISSSLKKQELFSNPFSSISLNKDSALKKLSFQPLGDMFRFSKPWLRSNGGYISYMADYRSNIDTPYAEKNIMQHLLTGTMRFSVAKNLPLIANFWIRRTNSPFFRNINDVQIQFDAATFHRQLAEKMHQRVEQISKLMNDSLLKKMYLIKQTEWNSLSNWLKDPRQIQKLIECNETIKVPQKSYDPALPDSTNKKNTDSLQKLATAFIAYYNLQKQISERLGKERDSLLKLYSSLQTKLNQYKQGLSAPSFAQVKDYIGEDSGMPPFYKWLLGVRRFSIGKSTQNYSELTSKNLSISGINFEYNSWYYLAVSAGLLDFRFHDFVVRPGTITPQPFYLLRAGLGHLEKNYFILSYYHGKKQLFGPADSASRYPLVSITGVSAEAKLQLNQYSFLKGEIAQSVAPDYHFNPATKNRFDFKDPTNQAYSVVLHSYIPQTGTKLDGGYKYTGANFQSFSSFQVNSEWRSWNARIEQGFFRSRLKVVVALQTNDFSNPYIVQQYKSNTIFKNFSVSYRSRGLPTLNLGYMPMSQYTIVGNQVVENRFQTLTANLNHFYKIGNIQASTMVVLNKFYNNNADTSFIFYKATNWYISQCLQFREFSGSLNISCSSNANYVLNVAGEEVNFNFSKWGSAGAGVKINNFNGTETKIGESVTLSIRTGNGDYLSLRYENSFLPSYQHGLVQNAFGNLQLVKAIR